jgi:hypothetical protein
MTTAEVPAATPRPVAAKLVIPLLAGGAVAVLLGVYGKEHDPTGEQPYSLFFTATINLKVWFASLAVVFALIQILTALRIYGKITIPRSQPEWFGSFHRLSGALAFGFTLPVAYQCLWALGFQSATTRVLIHSITGCFLYGAIAAKVFFVRERGLPGWVLPIAGGFVFTAFVVVWWTSALWFLQNYNDLGLELF